MKAKCRHCDIEFDTKTNRDGYIQLRLRFESPIKRFMFCSIEHLQEYVKEMV